MGLAEGCGRRPSGANSLLRQCWSGRRDSNPRPQRASMARAAASRLLFAQTCANLMAYERGRVREKDQETRSQAWRARLIRFRPRQRQPWTSVLWQPIHDVEGSEEGNRPWPSQGHARPVATEQRRLGGRMMAFGYRYTLERQENGWWLVRFPGIPEALTEGETEEEARANARDCVISALEGYMKAGKPLPREGAGHSGPDRAVLPSLVTAKLAVYETMRTHGWSKVKLAKELGMSENSVRRLLDLHHSSHMWIIDEALAKMNTELSVDLPKVRPSGRAA